MSGHVITSLCVRDGGCVAVCPVNCIVPGKPQDIYPLYYIDPETCIDCGACVRECPVGAIFKDEDVPVEYIAKEGQYLCQPAGTPGFDTVYTGVDYNDKPISIATTRILHAGEVIDLTPDITANADFFNNGPGYGALD